MKRSRLSASTSEDEDLDLVQVPKRGAHHVHHYVEQDRGGGASSTPSPTSSSGSKSASRLIREKDDKSFIDSKAQKMMAKMGYKSGTGLGKHSQGRVNPVELSTQRGRRGLGLHLEGLEPANLEWDASQEVVRVEEEVKWLVEDTHVPISPAQLRAWMKEGPHKDALDGETDFCDADVLRNVLSSKSVFDRLDKTELMKARTRSNPFETIGRGFFLNRAAMKMANMDAVFGFMFTNPTSQNHVPALGPNELLYFADVCAGPGGFSEYVLWRKGWEAKGFGMTLRDSNDFRLEDFHAAPCDTFEPYYGVKEDGNVYDPENIKSFQSFVLDNTFGHGVHFMMADGGFSVDGQENIQEILSKQLYLCQCLVALSIVRAGGHFVVKLFDVFTPFSVGLVYLMHKAFHQIAIHKPNTSRPANSERYLICKWKRDDSSSIRDYMYDVNQKLWRPSNKKLDINELVPVSVMKEDELFYDFIVHSNNSLGERQIINLVKIRAFCQDETLSELRQTEMKKACLEFWNVPDKTRTAPKIKSPEDKCKELFNNSPKPPPWMSTSSSELNPAFLNSSGFTLYDWRCLVLANNKEDRNACTFYLGLNRGFVYSWERNNWVRCNRDLNLTLSPDTLVFGEIAMELRGEKSRQVKIPVLHIIDAVFLGGKDVSALHLKERHEMCRKFSLALNKPTKPMLMRVIVKELFRLEDLEMLFSRLEHKGIKAFGGSPRLAFMQDGPDERFFLPGGLIFFKATLDPWTMAFSRSQNRKYWFNRNNQQSTFSCLKETIANFEQCFVKRMVWWWEKGVSLTLQKDPSSLPQDRVHRDTLMKRVHALLPK